MVYGKGKQLLSPLMYVWKQETSLNTGNNHIVFNLFENLLL